MPVLDPGRGRTKICQFWAYAVDDRAWKGPIFAEQFFLAVYAQAFAARRRELTILAYEGLGLFMGQSLA
jgi:transposase